MTPATHVRAGLDEVVAAETRLSSVDGQAGELIIAGFAVEELAPRATFEEVVFLLWNDALPTAAQLAEFRQRLAAQRGVPPITLEVLRAAAAQRAVPMDALRMAADTLTRPGTHRRMDRPLLRATTPQPYHPPPIRLCWRTESVVGTDAGAMIRSYPSPAPIWRGQGCRCGGWDTRRPDTERVRPRAR